MRFKQTAKKLGGEIQKSSPIILTAIAVGGVVTTVILAVRATPKASDILREHTEELDNGDILRPDKVETIKLCWKIYIPAACVGAATIACIIGANSINIKRNAALASAYGLTQAAFKEYKGKVVEQLGSAKELKVRDSISADKVKANPIGDREVVVTGKGDIWCMDSFTGQYFKSDMESIRKAINDANEDLLSDGWFSINDLFYKVGGGLRSIKQGDELGWDYNRSGQIKIDFSTQLTEKGEPCLVLNYAVEPRYLR